jgi:hypothetical protein
MLCIADVGPSDEKVTNMQDTTAYEFSRIFRQGWNAAKKSLADGNSPAESADAAALNPYSAVAERLRWSEGFEQALSSPAKPYNTPGGSAWRPARQKRD